MSKPLDESDVRQFVRLVAPALEWAGGRIHWDSNIRRWLAAWKLARVFRRRLLAMPHKD